MGQGECVLFEGLIIAAVLGPTNMCRDADLVSGRCAAITSSIDSDAVDLTGRIDGTGSRDGGTPDDDAPDPGCLNPSAGTCIVRDAFTIVSPVTIADLASFRPTPAVDRMQPNGWAIRGLDTNFYSTGGASIVDGTVLDQPASVRFTPIAWSWNYGDGDSTTSATSGTTWAAQKAAEFDPTPTSHVFTDSGTYVIGLTVTYAAEYRFAGGPWVPVVGSLALPANELTVWVGSVKTVLVNRECTRDPAGPGC